MQLRLSMHRTLLPCLLSIGVGSNFLPTSFGLVGAGAGSGMLHNKKFQVKEYVRSL